MKSLLKEAKLAICKLQKDIRYYYNCKQTLTLVFQSDDKVYLDFMNIQTICLSTRLSYQCLESYVIKK